MESSTSMDPPLLNNDHQEEEAAAATATAATSITEEEQQQPSVIAKATSTTTTEQQQQQQHPVTTTTTTTPSMTQPVLSTTGSTTAANDIEKKESTTTTNTIEERGTDYYAYSSPSSVVGGTGGEGAAASAATTVLDGEKDDNDDDEEQSNNNYHSLPEYPDAVANSVIVSSKASYHAYEDHDGSSNNSSNDVVEWSAIGYLRIFLISVLALTVILSPFYLKPDYYRVNPLSAYGEIQQCTDYSYDESKIENWGNLPCKTKNMCGQEGSGQSPIDITKTYCTDDRCIGENAVSVIKESNILNYYSYNENVCTLMDLTSKVLADVSAKTYYTFASSNEKCDKPIIEVEQEEWELYELQFHTGGSEHTIESIRYDGELHLIHKKKVNATTTTDDYDDESSSSSTTLIIAIPLTTNNPYYYNYNNERRRKLEEDNNNNNNNGGDEQEQNNDENNENNNNNDREEEEEEEDGEDNNDNDRDDENDNDRDDDENDNNEDENNDRDENKEEEKEEGYNYGYYEGEVQQYYDNEEKNDDEEAQKQYYANDNDNADDDYKSYNLEPLLIYYEAISDQLSNACDETTSVKQRTKTLPTYVDSNYIDHSQVTLDEDDYYYNNGNDKNNIIDVWSPYNLIPSNAGVYMYDGTFTTPPCTSGVKWIIMDVPLQISKNQMKRLNQVVSSTHTPKWPSCEYSDDDDDDDDDEIIEKHSTYRPIQSQSSKVVDHECTFLTSSSS